MTLSSVEGKVQEPVGKKEYWNGFHRFRNTTLHLKISKEIADSIKNMDHLNSMHLGSRILTKISKENPELLSFYGESQIGSLFGMTLWNLLASHEEQWYFYREPLPESDEIAGMIYFRKNDIR